MAAEKYEIRPKSEEVKEVGVSEEEVRRTEPPRIRTGDEQLDAIREQIEQTERDMSETFHAIEERFTYERLRAQIEAEYLGEVKEQARQTLMRAKESLQGIGPGLVDTLKRHPMPIALTALGLGLLTYELLRGKSEEKYLLEAYPRFRRKKPEEHYEIGLTGTEEVFEEPGSQYGLAAEPGSENEKLAHAREVLSQEEEIYEAGTELQEEQQES